MWLHVPSTSCPSAPVWEALNSAFTWRSGTGPELSVTLSGKSTQRPLSWRGWMTRAWIKRLCGTIFAPSTAQRGVDAWTSSLLASHASRGVPPASAAAQTTPGGSGLLYYGSLWTWHPDTCSWRTCQGSLLDMGLSTSCPDLPKRGSMRNGVISVRQKSGRATDGNGCLFWPTPDAGQYGSTTASDGSRTPLLGQTAQRWPTPKGRDWKGQSERGVHAPQDALPNMTAVFSRQVQTTPKPGGASSPSGPTLRRLWITPRTANMKGSTQRLQQGSNDSIKEQAQALTGKKRLNPAFVEWLMGWPAGWTDCERAVTGWCLYKQRMRSVLCSLLRSKHD